MRTLIAIDPGMNGGLAVRIEHDIFHGVHVEELAHKMPDTIKDIIDCLRIPHNNTGENIIYLEDVHTMKGQGIVSSGKFMRHQGCLETAAICLGYKLIYVRPQVWQKALGLLTKKGDSKTQHKNKIKAFAQQRYPNIKVTLATADALAILEYAKEKEKGESK